MCRICSHYKTICRSCKFPDHHYTCTISLSESIIFMTCLLGTVGSLKSIHVHTCTHYTWHACTCNTYTVFHGEKLYEIFRINIVTTAYVHTKCTWFISFNVHSFNFRTWLGLQKCFNSEKFPNYGTCTSRVHNAQKGEPDNDVMHKSCMELYTYSTCV